MGAFPWDKLPRVPRMAAEASRWAGRAHAAARRAAAAAAARLGVEIAVEAGPIGVVAQEGLPEARVVVRVRGVGGGRIAVAIDGAVAARLAAVAMRDARPELPAARRLLPVEKAVIEHVAREVVAAEAGMVVEGVGEAVGLEGGCVGFDAHARVITAHGGVAGLVTVMWQGPFPATSPMTSPAAAGVGGPISCDPDSLRRLDRAPVAGTIAQARVLVGSATLADLRPRDVLALGTPRRDDVFLCLARGAFRGHLSPTRDAFVATTSYDPGAPTMDLNPLAQDLPVELTCELARVTLTAKDVLELAPGAVIPLGVRVGAQVALIAGGRTVARGELVDVDGEVGVRIVTIG